MFGHTLSYLCQHACMCGRACSIKMRVLDNLRDDTYFLHNSDIYSCPYWLPYSTSPKQIWQPTDVSWRIMSLFLHCNADLHYISITLTATVECVCFWDLYAALPAQDFKVQFFLLLSLSQGWYGCLFLNIWQLVIPVVSVFISAGTPVCFWHRFRQYCDVRYKSARVFPHCCIRKS